MTSNIKYGLIGFICLFVVTSYGQNDTKLVPIDTTNLMVDSTLKKDTLWLKYIPVVPISYLKTDAWYLQTMHTNASDTNINVLDDYQNYFAQKSNAFQLYFANSFNVKGAQIIYKVEQRYSLPDKDILFYLIVFIILVYGIINNLYPQYYPKLFSQFSQSSLRMLQNREQLVQNTFASFASNINFILSVSLMSTLLIFKQHLLPISFWQVYFYICVFFIVLYLCKYVTLQLVGYIFNTKDLIGTYIFVVFMVNKVLGILLIPFILLLAFSRPTFNSFSIIGAAILTLLLFLYRYLFSLTSVRNKLHISSFHFFLYLCAFEILPLLILYKFIVQFFGGTY
jgi:hypothetical protein